VGAFLYFLAGFPSIIGECCQREVRKLKIKMSGDWDDVSKKITETLKSAVEGTVNYDDLFTSEFMKANSKFESIDQLLTQSPLEDNNVEALEEIPNEFDDFINQNTDFEKWEDFRQAAGNEFAKRKLNEQGFNIK
jgi:hypothetical protein